MASAQKVWLLIVVLTATLIGYIVAQSLFQEAETQPEGADQGTEEPTYTEGNQEDYASDRIIVKLEQGSTRSDLEDLNQQNDASTEKDLPRSNVNVVELPQDLPVEEAVENYEASPDVEYAEPDFILKPSQTTANDSDYPKLYGLNNTGQNGGTADADVDAPEAWNTTTGDAGTVVAVIDEGVDINHPDLKNNIWTNPGETAGNGIDDDKNGYVDDVNGWDFYNNDATVYDRDPVSGTGDEHGTHVAGTIAAEGNNNLGVVGVNWKANIMPLKFLGPNGGYTSDAVEALNYAVNKGVKISNNSWGGGGYSQALLDAINRADASGHLFVVAAGNDGSNNDTTPSYPSSYNSANIVSVAATDNKDALAYFSNYGSTSVDIAAPGVGIYSTLPNNTYGAYSGTSMATPHVTGVAALLKSRNPSVDDGALRTQILESIDEKSTLSDRMVAEGRLNAAQGLGALMVSNVTPANQQTEVARGTDITATFSKEMNESTLTSSTVQLQKEVRYKKKKRWVVQWVPVSAELSYDATTRTVTLDPSVSLAGNSNHRVIITTGVKDKDDNALAQDYSWTFTTIDTISSKNPDQGNTGVAPDTNITATFSEEMDPATLVTDPTTNTSPSVQLYELVRQKKKYRWVPISATQVSCDDPCRTITIDPYPSDPSTLLTANKSYMVVVTTGAKEKTGNPPLAQNYSWTFTTGSS